MGASWQLEPLDFRTARAPSETLQKTSTKTASASGELTGGTGSYSLATNAANGRGTGSVSIDWPGTDDFVLYMVSSSEALAMTTDTLTPNTPILSGEIKLQTGPFSTSMLDNSNYVFYGTGIDSNDGANATILGQIATTTNGVATTNP